MLEQNQVRHDSQNIAYRSPVGAAEAGSKVRMGIRLWTKEGIRQVLLRCWHDQTGEKLIPMTTNDDPNAEQHDYTGTCVMPEKGGLIWYYFIIVMEDGTWFYGNNPEQLGGVGMVYDHVPPSFQITVYNKGAKTPDWFKHAVMYQIFPDRFCREGNEIIEKKGGVIHTCWQDDPCYYKDPDTKEIVAYDFFGGNLKGIEKKLDYLKDLGISVIYLNPVFESESNHHYDTGDYHKIDPILGTNEDFHHLVAEAKKKGIRIILDGVFSHTGSNSRYFNRSGQYNTIGAFQSPDSPYYEWYNFRNFPYEYDCWWNFSTLPNVTETTPSYMDFIIYKPDSVLHHWMGEGISGWRLDVIDELPAAFSQAFYAELKKTDPEAVMIGEVWEDASHKVAYGVPREYLCGQEMDSAMNYPFRKILFDFLLGHADGIACRRRFESLRENYPKENFYAMMNLIGSHDVERAMTILGEAPYYDSMPAIEQSRFRMDSDQYNLGLARLLMAALWQMTYPGVPCVYYGDEIAMQGFKDPYNRRPYDWEHGDTYVRSWYERLIRMRNEHVALQTGELLPLYADTDVMAYARLIRGGQDVFGAEAPNEIFIVLFNRSRNEEKTVTINVQDFASGTFADAFQESTKYEIQDGKLTVKLPPLKGQLLYHEKPVRHYPRKAGVLLHPSSLPSKYGIGDFGKEAYRFVDFLRAAGQKVWQVLPLGPVDYGYSPYQSPSAFAGNPLLIDIDELVEAGWLTRKDVKLPFVEKDDTVEFEAVKTFKTRCFKRAHVEFQKDAHAQADYQAFCAKEAYWLDDYALFQAAKKEYRGASWTSWPEPVKLRKPDALKNLRDRLAENISLEKFVQYLFYRQWQRLHEYANAAGIQIMGDMPIFLSQDSADVWANQCLFDLNSDGTPHSVAGVPPDYFSATGQLWGNPQYDWQAMKAEDYAWWKRRFHKLYELVDIARIDHFRGFESYWEIDGKAKTAINGCWKPGPGKPFFDTIMKELGNLPIVAEDLGIITPEVEKLRDDCKFPGMKVLQFTLQFNECGRLGTVAPENSVVYTGTHDNNTMLGWLKHDIPASQRDAVAHLVHADGKPLPEVVQQLIAYAYASDARLAIVPMQDILALDSNARMNTPGTAEGNWKWCLKPDYLMEVDASHLAKLCQTYNR